MKINHIKDRVYYLPGSVNIGIIKAEDGVILIDTGLDNSTGKKILKALEIEGMFPIAVINTHSHADHCGGNSIIKEKTAATFYAPYSESGIIENPYIEPLYLFSGANPIKDLHNKFLMAEPSVVDKKIMDEQKEVIIKDLKIQIHPLPGHSPGQIGIEFDKVFFCADSFFSISVLEKHKIPFYIDIKKEKNTLRFLKDLNYDYYLPSHGKLSLDIREIVDANLDVIKEIEKNILKALSNNKSSEELFREITEFYKLNINSTQQYYLLKTAIEAYLSYLYNKDIISLSFINNIIYWKNNKTNI